MLHHLRDIGMIAGGFRRPWRTASDDGGNASNRIAGPVCGSREAWQFGRPPLRRRRQRQEAPPGRKKDEIALGDVPFQAVPQPIERTQVAHSGVAELGLAEDGDSPPPAGKDTDVEGTAMGEGARREGKGVSRGWRGCLKARRRPLSDRTRRQQKDSPR
jgi:hypothetical protein